MQVIGLDVGRNHAVAAALDHFPLNLQRYYQQHHREFIRLSFNKDGFNQLWKMLPDVVVMEPSGGWYSRLIAEKCLNKNIEVLWVGHAQLKAQRESYGFKNKRDPEDALSLAACYFDERFITVHGQSRFLKINPQISQLKDWFYEWEQMNKIKNVLINHIRQRLCYEFPETAQQRINNDKVHQKLQCSPFWAALAGIHSYWQFEKALDNSQGDGISNYTRQHCQWICEVQQQIQILKSNCNQFINQEEFQPYLKAMQPFKFGLKNQVGLLIQIYPFEKFLVNNQPWVEHRISRNGKRVKCDRSLRSFQAYLGLSFHLEQSGDSGQIKKQFSGSKVCRSHLYCWAKVEFDQQRGKRVQFSQQGKLLWEKHKQLRQLKPVKDGKLKADNGAIGGDDAIIRLLFRATAELYKNLCLTVK